MKLSKIRLSRTAIALLVGGAVAVSATAVLAQGEAISDARASEIALAEVAGTVEEIEREDEDGVATIEVDVRASDGTLHEVTLDAANGAVIAVEQDDDDDADEADEDETEDDD